MSNELVPRIVKSSPNDNVIAPFGERERMLCEVMFWLKSGWSYPVGIGNLDAFLIDLEVQSRRLWSAMDWYKQRTQVQQGELNRLRDEIEMLRRA